jgi:hypothetical protein
MSGRGVQVMNDRNGCNYSDAQVLKDSKKPAARLFEKSKGVAQCPIALLFDLEPMRGSQAGMTGATADGLPITAGRSSSKRNATPDQYAMSCASSVRAMPMSSTLNR